MNIYQHATVGAYLRAHIATLPRNGRGEVSRIAISLRVSPTLISQIVAGAKVLTPEQAELLCLHLSLTPIETEYLTFLVQKERAGIKSLREFWDAKLEEVKAKSKSVAKRLVTDRTLTEVERAVFYSSPLYSAISLYTSVGKKGKTLEEICARFDLPRKEAAQMLEFLVATNLCREEKGYFTIGSLKTHLESTSPFVRSHHCNWRLQAMHQCASLTEEELMFTSPISLAVGDFEVLRAEIVGFIEKLMKKVHDSPAEEIACLNLDFIWIKK